MTVDDIPVLAGLNVPHECYQRACSSTASSSKKSQQQQQQQQHPLSSVSPRDSSFPNRSTSSVPRRNSTASASGSQSSASDRDLTLASPVTAHPRYAPFPPGQISPHIPPTPVERKSAGAEGTRAALPPLYVPSQAQSPYCGGGTSPSPALSATSSAFSPHDGFSPVSTKSPAYGTGTGRAPATLVPLDRLRTGQAAPSLRRDRADDEILRSFRPL